MEKVHAKKGHSMNVQCCTSEPPTYYVDDLYSRDQYLSGTSIQIRHVLISRRENANLLGKMVRARRCRRPDV